MIVDDIGALTIIAFVYTESLTPCRRWPPPLAERYPKVEVAATLDRVKDAGFYWATRSGVTVALQGRFFEFGRALFADQQHQLPSDILRIVERLGLDVERFEADVRSPGVAEGAGRHARCRGDGHHGGAHVLHQRTPSRRAARRPNAHP